MTIYEVEYNYTLPEEGVFTLETPEALTMDEVEDLAMVEIKQTFPEVTNIQIEGIKELPDAR